MRNLGFLRPCGVGFPLVKLSERERERERVVEAGFDLNFEL